MQHIPRIALVLLLLLFLPVGIARASISDALDPDASPPFAIMNADRNCNGLLRYGPIDASQKYSDGEGLCVDSERQACTGEPEYLRPCDDYVDTNPEDYNPGECSANLAIDTDNDGFGDSCDTCPELADNQLDFDRDGNGDACDRCQGFDDQLDSDLDGMPDACDACPADATNDTDGDQICDSSDQCHGWDDSLSPDSDLDGICDPLDPCPGDPLDDSDADGICDHLDKCRGFDDFDDADGDYRPDQCDLWPTCDDTLDRDADSIPDGCDTCAGDPSNQCSPDASQPIPDPRPDDREPVPPMPQPQPEPAPAPIPQDPEQDYPPTELPKLEPSQPHAEGCSATTSPGIGGAILILLSLGMLCGGVLLKRFDR